MGHVSEELRGAIVGFIVLLSKGMLGDERWDWDVERLEWRDYQEGFADPTVLKTTLSVSLNNLLLDDSGRVLNYGDARLRAFQYFRAQVDPSNPLSAVVGEFSSQELEEPDWRIWET